MPEVKIINKHGVTKRRFNSPVRADDEITCAALLAHHAHELGLGSGTKLLVKHRKGGWRTAAIL